MANASTTRECPHQAVGKYLVARGGKENLTGFLACKQCLTEKDFAAYPGSKNWLEGKERQAEQLDRNLGRTPHPETEWVAVPEATEATEGTEGPLAATATEG